MKRFEEAIKLVSETEEGGNKHILHCKIDRDGVNFSENPLKTI
jgi:hypothetical protein